MEAKHRILVTLGIAFVLVTSFFLVTEAISKYTGFAVTEKNDLSDFKVCLREKDITLYLNTNILVESLKDIVLEGYLEDIKIVNCLRNNQVCVSAGVNSFPSWIVEGTVVEGDIVMNELSDLTGCRIITNK